MTHTKTNVIQYNEYYPFGLQASNSWTRDNTVGNQFLYNEASELNATTGFYDLPFRNYDATLGRFFQVDPLAQMDASTSPFVYGGNNPVVFNDPSGALMSTGEVGRYNMPGSGGFRNTSDESYWTAWHNDFVAASDARNEAYTGGATGHGDYSLFWSSFFVYEGVTYGVNVAISNGVANIMASRVNEDGSQASSPINFGYGWANVQQDPQLYTFNQYVKLWEDSHHLSMSENQRNTLLSGCIGITSLELGNNRNKVNGEPFNTRAYNSFRKAKQEANKLAGEIKNPNERVIIYSIRFWAKNPSEYRPDDEGRIDMSSWSAAKANSNPSRFGRPPFDFGLYDPTSNSWWHANTSGHNMTILKSSTLVFDQGNNYFNVQVWCVEKTDVPSPR